MDDWSFFVVVIVRRTITAHGEGSVRRFKRTRCSGSKTAWNLPAQKHMLPEAEHKLEIFKFLSMRLAGDMQPLLRWSTFEATYRRIGYALGTSEEQSGGCCNTCSGNSCRLGNPRVRRCG